MVVRDRTLMEKVGTVAKQRVTKSTTTTEDVEMTRTEKTTITDDAEGISIGLLLVLLLLLLSLLALFRLLVLPQAETIQQIPHLVLQLVVLWRTP